MQRYEDYLDEHITATDRFYLEAEDLARNLVEIGSRKADILSRQEFVQKLKDDEIINKKQLNADTTRLVSSPSAVYDSVLLAEIAKRESELKSGHLATLVYLCALNSLHQEISGFIDLGERLKTEGAAWFATGQKRKPFFPSPKDLSFHNFDLRKTQTRPESEHFQVVSDSAGCKLQFRVKADRKLIDVSPGLAAPGDATSRTEIDTRGEYLQCVFFDHTSKRRAP